MSTVSLASWYCAKERGGDKFPPESRSYVSSNAKEELCARDFLQGKLGRLNMCLLRPLECPGSSSKSKRLGIIARIKKGKKHDYPWPDDIDPNIKSGHLRYLSSFKPLEDKPKPVTLAFEKPLVDLEQKIVEVRRMADETGLDFSSQINTLETKYRQALKDLYKHLSPIQRLNIARHPNRPTVLDHIFSITEKWVELHGDRAGYDDPAIVTGIGTINGKSYMFIGHQKGRNTKENIARNFAMPTPHGYRKALRLMKYADHHGFPIVTLIDTPGAYADLKSEELGQGEAIAQNLRTMFGLKVPIITIVTGEGGSGGALAIGCCNKMFMLENSAFYVASPEACAAILWKSAQASPLAAEKLRITAQEHYRFKIADAIIPEPLGGAHANPVWTSEQIKVAILEAMEELGKMSAEELIQHRRLKYRHIGGIQEGLPIDPDRKRNMKPSEVNLATSVDIESDLENLKKMIQEAKPVNEPITSQTIEKLRQDVDQEITKAFISMGLQGELESIKLEISKSSDEVITSELQERADKLTREFKLKFSKPGEYMELKDKLAKLESINRLIVFKEESERLKSEINAKVPTKVKEKLMILKATQAKFLQGEDIDRNQIAEQVENARKEVEEALKACNLEIVGVSKKPAKISPDIEKTLSEVEEEIKAEIKRAIDTEEIKEKIEEWKIEAENSTSEKAEKLQEEVKQRIVTVMDVDALKEKVEKLGAELSSVFRGKDVSGNGRL